MESFSLSSTITDLKNADWTRKWIFFELSFFIEKLSGFAVCREAVQTVVQTILQALYIARTRFSIKCLSQIRNAMAGI